MTAVQYVIGREYNYQASKTKFKLAHVGLCKFVFECGHWCTDTVFLDLIDCTTGIQVYKNNQLTLF